MLIKIRVRVLCPGSKGAPYVHTKGSQVHVLVSWDAFKFHCCKGQADSSIGAGRGSGEVASDLKPPVHDWDEWFVCPLSVVGRVGGRLWPDHMYPGAKCLAASKNVGRRLGWPWWVVVPATLSDQAMSVSVFSAHAHPITPKGTGTAEDLSYCS